MLIVFRLWCRYFAPFFSFGIFITKTFLFVEAVLTSTHNLCFEQNPEKYQNFLSKNFHFLVVKFSVYLKRSVFVMLSQKVGT